MATPNIVPRADSEGGIGTSSKYWASAYIDLIYVGAGKIGRDADNLIDFSTDNQIRFTVSGVNEIITEANAFRPASDDGISLGVDARGWSDLFLASGAVINFDEGNVTLTHSSNALTLADNDKFELGTGGDLQLYHSGTYSNIDNNTGDFYITNHQNDGDIVLRSDDGSGGITAYLTLDGGLGYNVANKHIRFSTSTRAYFGDSNNGEILHNGSIFSIQNLAGTDMKIINYADDGDIIFESDDGSGGTTAYLTLDGSATRTVASKDIQLSDSVNLAIGNGPDAYITHTGTVTNFLNYTGNLQFTQHADDGDIIFSSDDGAGGAATYFYLDGSSAAHDGSATTDLYTNWPDKSRISLGTSHDFLIVHDGANSYLKNETGDLHIRNDANDKDIVFSSDDGSGNVTAYLTLDGSAGNIAVAKTLLCADSKGINIGASNDLQISHNGSNSGTITNTVGNLTISNSADDGDIIFQSDDGSGGVETYFYLDGSENLARFSVNTRWNDSDKIQLGTGGDLNIYHTGSTSFMMNYVGDVRFINYQDDGDFKFETDDGAGGTTEYFRIDGGAVRTISSQHISMNDGKALYVGDGLDAGFYHSGGHNFLETNSGNLTIVQNTDDGDIIFQCDDGSGGVATYFFLDGSSATGSNEYTVWPDSSAIAIGTGKDLQLYHNGSSSSIYNNTGDLVITNAADDGDIIFQSDDGSGGTTAYLTLDGGYSTPQIIVPDSVNFNLGTGLDLALQHDGSNSFITNNVGNLTIKNNTDDGDIIFQSDDGSGGVETYFFLDGSAGSGTPITNFPDGSYLTFGASQDLQIYHDGTDSVIQNNTGDLEIQNRQDDGDIIFKSDDGSGGVTAYITLDGSAGYTTVQKQMRFGDGVFLQIGDSADLAIYHQSGNSIIANEVGPLILRQNLDDGDILFQADDGSGGTTEYFRLDGGDVETVFSKTTHHLDGVQARFGLGGDLRIHHDGSNSFIAESGTGNLYIDASDQIIFRNSTQDEIYAQFALNGGVSLRYDNSVKFTTTTTGISVTGATGTTEGGGIDATDAVSISVGTINGEIITTINVDIGVGGILSSSTAGDVIGNDGVASAYLTRLTTAINGIVYKGEMICVEVPTTGDPDINLAASSESGIAEDAAGEGQHVLINGGVATLAAKNDITIPSGGIVGDYLYLTHGGTTAGTYNAGQFIIKLYGAATL